MTGDRRTHVLIGNDVVDALNRLHDEWVRSKRDASESTNKHQTDYTRRANLRLRVLHVRADHFITELKRLSEFPLDQVIQFRGDRTKVGLAVKQLRADLEDTLLNINNTKLTEE